MTKRGPQGETGYINQWMTLRNGEIGTKHVFAGTTRVVSKLVKQDKPNSKRNSGGDGTSKGKGQARIVYEKDQYYFHPDHLGTTAYITHTNGQVYQHLEYFPFGETWIEEHSNKQRTPYQFTGKELDEETGLYYFGARYYDPRMSVWQSPDPALSDYFPAAPYGTRVIVQMVLDSLPNIRVRFDLIGGGGIFEPKNLGLYSYADLNPLLFIDPDGRTDIELDWGLGKLTEKYNLKTQVPGEGSWKIKPTITGDGMKLDVSYDRPKYKFVMESNDPDAKVPSVEDVMKRSPNIPELPTELPRVGDYKDLKDVGKFLNGVRDAYKDVQVPEPSIGPGFRRIEDAGSLHIGIGIETSKDDGGSFDVKLNYKF